ncbi:lysine-specific demethylase 8 [Biomphalaria glabrata]|uniref:Uncharacterized protein LOC106070968 n=1 Tax=Biomphalaria glabrata TaxID=6526 RepID=A0A9U8EG66_BIOGL|nr:uncharacterized protein LOC106070968 [Biomphalaria glabrata]KAI8756098.1 lysine-specific demethylase 8-like [Biomphalaria glabrata]
MYTSVKNILSFVLLICFLPCCLSQTPKAKPYKSKNFLTPPRGVTLIGKISNPAVFYGHFVHPSKPLWMRSVLESVDHPGITDWTDDYLRKKYPNEPVKVETSKKEDRSKPPTWLTINQFLSYYTSEELYLVHSLDGKMSDMVLVPQNLHCGGFQKMIQQAVLWLGSGEIQSVLHYDELDNMLCMLEGQKHVILIDKAHKADVEAEGFVEAGGYSLVDVDNIDRKKFPKLYNIEWYEVLLNQGDCLFIPRGWYHRMKSSGHRHMAINIWFAHLHWFDSDNCSIIQDFYKPLEPISTFGFASPNEVYRSKLLDKLVDKGFIIKDVLISALDTGTVERRSKFFDAVNKYQDGVLSWSEMYGFNIDKALAKFPDIFGLPGNVADDTEEVILYDPIIDVPSLEDNEENSDDDEIVTGSSDLQPDDPGIALSQGVFPLPDDPASGSTNTKEDLDTFNSTTENDSNENIITTNKPLKKKIEL